MPMSIGTTEYLLTIAGAFLGGGVVTYLLMHLSSPTAARIFWAKLLQKKNMVRKIYPGSRREKLYLPKKSTPDDLFIMDKGKVDVIDGAMKTEFGSTMMDGIRIHTVMAGDMAPMGPEAAASATFMVRESQDKEKYPYISRIRESHKVTDLLACDMEHLEKKVRKYLVLATDGKTKEQIKAEKDQAVPAMMNEVVKLRGVMAAHPYPVDYITAINAVLNPVVHGIVELIDIFLQKKNEDEMRKKMNLMQYGMVFAGVIGSIAISGILIWQFMGNK